MICRLCTGYTLKLLLLLLCFKKNDQTDTRQHFKRPLNLVKDVISTSLNKMATFVLYFFLTCVHKDNIYIYITMVTLI